MVKQNFLVELPYPPSVNHYWRHVGAQVLLSREGRAYRERLAMACVLGRLGRHPGPVAVSLLVFPPDRRRRDLDNVLKALLDGLEHAGVIQDDAMVWELHLYRRSVIPGGRVTCAIEDYDGLRLEVCGSKFNVNSAAKRRGKK